jgi:hypothetical protein
MFPAYSHHSATRVSSSATYPEVYLLRPFNARVPALLAEPAMCMSAIPFSFIARHGRISGPDLALSPNPRSRITSHLRYAAPALCARSSGRSFAVSGNGSRAYRSTKSNVAHKGVAYARRDP